MKPKIQEIIVVEGKDDTKRIQEVVEADTIETIGSAINETILKQIAFAQELRGVIVFTDPDFSGEKIRKIITEEVPAAKHAFLPRKEAKPRKKGSLGVEHASDEAILHALTHLMTPRKQQLASFVTPEMLMSAGLVAGPHAKKRRERLGDILQIGYTNGKQLGKRLTMFEITEDTFQQAMKTILEEEIHE